MIKKCLMIMFIMLLTTACLAERYPTERYVNLIPFEIGVKGYIEDVAFFKFYYENIDNGDGTITTSGHIEVNPLHPVEALHIQYVLVDKSNEILKVVELFDGVTSKNSQSFTATYPYNPDYELCAFHVNALAKSNERDTNQDV